MSKAKNGTTRSEKEWLAGVEAVRAAARRPKGKSVDAQTRLKMLHLLLAGDMYQKDIAKECGVGTGTVSRFNKRLKPKGALILEKKK